MLSALARPSVFRRAQASVSWSPLDERWYRDVAARSASGINVLPETAVQLAVVYRAINVRAHAVASIPLVIYRRLPNDGKERATDHPQYDLLHDTPNAYQTSFRWRHLMVTQRILYGNHYSEMLPGRGGAGELSPLSPTTTRVVDQLADGRLVYETRDISVRGGTGPPRRLLSDEVLHIRGFSLDGKSGLPLPHLARNAMGLALAAEKHGSMFLRKGQQLAGVLSADGDMDDETRKKNEEAWQRSRGGPEGSGQTPILTRGMKYTPISSTNKDSQWLEARTFQVEELLRFLGVPGVLCGYADKTATFASAEQFFLSFVTHTVAPETTDIAAEITQTVVVGSPEYYADFVLEGLLRGDVKTRYSAHQLAITSGWKTRNEVRVEESYNKGPEALDEFLEPLNMVNAGDRPDDTTSASAPNPAPAAKAPSTAVTEASRAMAQELTRLRTRIARRLATREVNAIAGSGDRMGAAKRYAANLDGWHQWLAEFYAAHAADVADELGVAATVATGYCEQQRTQLATGVASTFGADFHAASVDRLLALTASTET